MDFIENIVIGAGALGLAVARKFQIEKNNVLLIERDKYFFSETSSRNSEVIHSGLYYEDDSLKSELCLKGKQFLYSYLKLNNIPFKRCGKLIVGNGSSAQKKKLEELIYKAEKRQIDYKIYSNKHIKSEFGFLRSSDNIFIQETGIFDSHKYGLSLLKDFENSGGAIGYTNLLQSFIRKNGKFVLNFNDTDYKISCKNLFLCAGLDSINILSNSDYDDLVPIQRLNKGDYFSYSGKIKSKSLIYPIPNEHSLGVHLTCDLDGKIKFGPDSNFVDSKDYIISPNKKAEFLKKINDYIPEIKLNEIEADYSGIRPKIEIEGNIYNDFYPIFKVFDDSFFGTILGYESPGLTSSLAAADLFFDVFNGG